MKKKLALLMAAIMTVAMVPMTAFASTKLTAVDEIYVSKDTEFTSRVELKKGNDQVDIESTVKGADDSTEKDAFEVYLTLTNGKFTKDEDTADKNDYIIENDADNKATKDNVNKGVYSVKVISDTKALVTLDTKTFNDDDSKACVLAISAKAVETGDVVAKFTSNVNGFKSASEVIATASAEEVKIESEGVATFVEDAAREKKIKDITIDGLVEGSISEKNTITLKLSGDYTFLMNGDKNLGKFDEDGKLVNNNLVDVVTFLNAMLRLMKISQKLAIIK